MFSFGIAINRPKLPVIVNFSRGFGETVKKNTKGGELSTILGFVEFWPERGGGKIIDWGKLSDGDSNHFLVTPSQF